jgi:hypothetical protein
MGIYAAYQMGIHGFFVSTIPEIAPFGIEVTLVDGHVAHQFRLAERGCGTTGDFRRMTTAADLAIFPGERKVASAIIASAHQHPAPKRLTLGRTPMRLLTKP